MNKRGESMAMVVVISGIILLIVAVILIVIFGNPVNIFIKNTNAANSCGAKEGKCMADKCSTEYPVRLPTPLDCKDKTPICCVKFESSSS